MTRDQAYEKATAMGFTGLFAVKIADALMEAVIEERNACAEIADRWGIMYLSSIRVASEIRQRTG